MGAAGKTGKIAMKSPAQIRARLKRQWENRSCREARLLLDSGSWPLVVPIGRPAAKLITADLDALKRHVDAWKQVEDGVVVWERIRYRAADGAVNIPTGWMLRRPSEWIAACKDPVIKREFENLGALVEQTPPLFHPLLVRRRSLWRGKPLHEVVQAARLAMALEPGSAGGMPLRMLGLEGIDTKFFERHGSLIVSFLDVRFDNDVSEMGLEAFLGAAAEGEHWLLVIDLDGGLLPFEKQRVRTSELRECGLPGANLLIVENESCQSLLPKTYGTTAVLGAGFDLGWTDAEWLRTKRVAYWGDIDTWGLQYLAKVRQAVPSVEPILMSQDTFSEFAVRAVREPVIADSSPPTDLTDLEQILYQTLLAESCGRLEQEFLPDSLVRRAICDWAGNVY
jgi:hypothetical protein